jgi:hypothetical protein
MPKTAAFTEAIEVTGDRVTIQPACECNAALILRLAEATAPVPATDEGCALTRKVLGVEFEGRARVLPAENTVGSSGRENDDKEMKGGWKKDAAAISLQHVETKDVVRCQAYLTCTSLNLI